jgi:hypothetical protein
VTPGTIIEKQYARRSLVDYRMPYIDPFGYRSVAEIGEPNIIEMLIPFIDNLSNPDTMAQATMEYQALVEHAGSEYHPENWLVAFLNDTPIGVVFPTKWYDQPEGGSISFITVFTNEQGKGYGNILHAKGLEMLVGMGVTKYVGSTVTSNIPMLRIFEKNGCETGPIRKFRVDERGMHIPYEE